MRAAKADRIADVAACEADVGEHAVVERVQLWMAPAPSLPSDRSKNGIDPIRDALPEAEPVIGSAAERSSNRN